MTTFIVGADVDDLRALARCLPEAVQRFRAVDEVVRSIAGLLDGAGDGAAGNSVRSVAPAAGGGEEVCGWLFYNRIDVLVRACELEQGGIPFSGPAPPIGGGGKSLFEELRDSLRAIAEDPVRSGAAAWAAAGGVAMGPIALAGLVAELIATSDAGLHGLATRLAAGTSLAQVAATFLAATGVMVAGPEVAAGLGVASDVAGAYLLGNWVYDHPRAIEDALLANGARIDEAGRSTAEVLRSAAEGIRVAGAAAAVAVGGGATGALVSDLSRAFADVPAGAAAIVDAERHAVVALFDDVAHVTGDVGDLAHDGIATAGRAIDDGVHIVAGAAQDGAHAVTGSVQHGADAVHDGIDILKGGVESLLDW